MHFLLDKHTVPTFSAINTIFLIVSLALRHKRLFAILTILDIDRT